MPSVKTAGRRQRKSAGAMATRVDDARDEQVMEMVASPAEHASRLIPALPDGAFVAKPEEIDRFVVRILPDGSLYFKGSRPRIDDFLAACAQVGLELHITHIALCG